MKTIIKTILAKAVENDLLWKILKTAHVESATFITGVRKRIENTPIINRAIEQMISDLTVRHGVFAGMKYPASE